MKELVTTKVTRLGDSLWGIRIWIKGHLWSERTVERRVDISPAIQSDLRMIDKCGGGSPMAYASRHRAGRKAAARARAE